MEITPNNIVLISAILLFVSVFAGRAGSRYGVPTLVLFLGVGMLAGVDGFGIHFDSAETTQFIGMVSLSIILFSGGTDTKLRDIRPVLGPGLVLATVGVLITTAITGAFIYYVFHFFAPDHAFGWIESMLLAAIMSSTDSASVFSILGSARTDLKQNLRQTLELESGSNDPVAYLLVIMLIDMLESGGSATASGLALTMAGMLAVQLFVGAAGGLLIGFAAVWLVKRLKSDNEFMYPVLMIACVFFSFSLTELAGGNSYLAVYVSGLVVGNSKLPLKRTISTFFGGFTWLVQIIMFLTLGLLVNPSELVSVAVPGVALGLFMIIVSRPVAVFLCLLPFRKFSFKARLYIAWVGLRGAVPIIFATYALISPAVEHAAFMFNVVFFITLLSLLIQGTTVKSMARALDLCRPLKEPVFAGVELPEDISATMTECEVTPDMLYEGETLRTLRIAPKTLVIIIKRRDGEYVVPRGDTRLRVGDKLLLLAETEHNTTEKTT